MYNFNLKPHQEKGVTYGKRQVNPAYLMDMRTGKIRTVVVCAIQNYDVKHVLVVTPSTALFGWISELTKMNISHTCLSFGNSIREELCKYLDNPTVFCIVHKEVNQVCPEISEIEWDMVIIDESHGIKNPKAEYTKWATRKFKHVQHKSILTGTPALNTSLNYFTQFQFLDNQFMNFTDYYAFRHSLFTQIGMNFYPKSGVKNRINDYLSERAYVVLKSDAGIEVEPTHTLRSIKMSEKQFSLHEKIRKEFRTEETSTLFSCVVYTWLRQLCGGYTPEDALIDTGKFDELMNLILHEFDEESLVIFFNYNAELYHFKKMLNDDGVECSIITGEVPLVARKDIIANIQSSKQREIVLVQNATANAGLDLSTIDTCIFFSLPNSPTIYVQDLDRIVNMNKVNKPLYIYLAYENSLDIKIFNTLVEKKITAENDFKQIIGNYLEKGYDNVN